MPSVAKSLCFPRDLGSLDFCGESPDFEMLAADEKFWSQPKQTHPLAAGGWALQGSRWPGWAAGHGADHVLLACPH